MKNMQQKMAAAMGTLLLSSLATVNAAETSFQAVELAAGYQLSATEAACGADKKKTDDKETSDKTTEKAEKTTEAKCGEGKCGEGKCGGMN